MHFRRGLIRTCRGFGMLTGAALALAAAAPVKLAFTGVDASSDPVRVVLADPATRTQAWVPVGGVFVGCEVRGYDARRQTLTLARGAEIWELALESAGGASVGLSPEEAQRVSKQVTNNLRQLAAAADQYFLEYGVSTVRLDQLVGSGPGNYIKQLTPADGEDYTKLDLAQPSPTSNSGEWVIVTKRGVTVRHQR